MLDLHDRKLLYGLLAGLFHYPDAQTPDMLGELDAEAFAEVFPGLSAPPEVSDRDLEALQTAYTGLFVNRLGGVPAPPYGSVYLDEDPVIMGESSRQVLKTYQAEGLSTEMANEPPDFLPVELEFLYYLVEKEEADLEVQDEAGARAARAQQADFFGRLFVSWVPTFCEQLLAEEEAHPFYRWCAELLAHFCAMEAELLHP